MAWIDYQKAFDSLSHIRIVAVMAMYQICPTMRYKMIGGGIDEGMEN